jgi:hypothetical protein
MLLGKSNSSMNGKELLGYSTLLTLNWRSPCHLHRPDAEQRQYQAEACTRKRLSQEMHLYKRLKRLKNNECNERNECNLQLNIWPGQPCLILQSPIDLRGPSVSKSNCVASSSGLQTRIWHTGHTSTKRSTTWHADRIWQVWHGLTVHNEIYLPPRPPRPPRPLPSWIEKVLSRDWQGAHVRSLWGACDTVTRDIRRKPKMSQDLFKHHIWIVIVVQSLFP